MKKAKELHLGTLIQNEVFKMEISLQEISERMNMPIFEILSNFKSKSMDIYLIYKWSCFTKVNFFSIYTTILKNIELSIDIQTRIYSKFFNETKNIYYENEL